MENVKKFNLPLMTGENIVMPLDDPAGAISDSKYENLFPWINGTDGSLRVVINPDIDKAIEVLKKIKDNHGYCPRFPVKEKTGSEISLNSLAPDNRCPCPDMTCKGICQCGLFVNTPLISPKHYVRDVDMSRIIDNKEEEKE